MSLATHGVLFLDELGEFPVAVLEALRQPLEEGAIRVSRAGGTATFPAAFLLVAAMNPCPCGEGVFPGACTCTEVARARYRRRISAPLLDRFDLVVPLSRPDPDDLLSGVAGEASATVAARVTAGRARLGQTDGPQLAPDAEDLLAAKLRSGGLSARGLRKVAQVARTVAALAGEDVGHVRARVRGPLAAGRTSSGDRVSRRSAESARGGVCRCARGGAVRRSGHPAPPPGVGPALGGLAAHLRCVRRVGPRCRRPVAAPH